jgi:hypothetical protein
MKEFVAGVQSDFVSNASAIVSGGGFSPVMGAAIPGPTPFVIPTPTYNQGFRGPYQAALSPRHLYLVDSAYQLWEAPSPVVGRLREPRRRR